MALTPISQVIEALDNIRGALDIYPYFDDLRDRDSMEKRIFAIRSPLSHDLGGIERAIPIYETRQSAGISDVQVGVAVERLAWYRSYHYGLNGWGIYLLRSGIYKVADALLVGGVPSEEAIPRAIDFLIRHELTHFQTDYDITSLELATSRPIFVPVRRMEKISHPGWNLAEEGLSNSYGRSSLRQFKTCLDFFLNSSPQGYNNWAMYPRTKDHESWSTIIKGFISAIGSQIQGEIACEVANKLAPKYFSQVPVYEIFDDASMLPSDSYFLGSISEVLETDSFKEDLKKLIMGQPIFKKKWIAVKKKLAAGNPSVFILKSSIKRGRSTPPVWISKQELV